MCASNGNADDCEMSVELKVSVIFICAIFGIAYGRDVVSDSSSLSCAVGDFLCGNGECIDSVSVCDGTLDCKDGADESLPACGFRLASSAEKFSSIGVRMRRVPRSVRYSSCVVPPQPENGVRKLNRFFCNGDEDCDVVEGSSLDAGSQLTYNCEPGFSSEGNSHVYCIGEGKWSPIPVCKEIKCEALSTASTSADCSRHGSRINCEAPVLPGTKADVSCRAGYKQDTNSAITRRDKIECKISGEWHPKPIICIPACGVAIDRTTPLVLNGSTATVADFPWHATLYQESYKEKGPVKEFICGATVVHTKLVLTAAHCIYDEGTKSTTDPNTLHVATGNVFREFDSPLHDSNVVQKSPVRSVWRYCQYYGLQGNYVADIALLELQKPFTFSSILVPACLDISGFSNKILEAGSSGKVAGFGVTRSGVASAILQTITVPYVTYSACSNSRQGSDDEVLISDDKFCAGWINGTQSVCSGDSGGGLVFKKNDLWYVMGVVSVALGVRTQHGERTCETSTYTLYTKVSTYIHWIRDIMYQVEFSEYSSPCDLKCTPINSASTKTDCFLSGRWTMCNFPVPSQTKATISCREGYVKNTIGQDAIKCTSIGEWNPEPIVCVPSVPTMAESPTVPNVTTVTPPTTLFTPPSVSHPGISCDLPDGRSGVCAQADKCPYIVTRDSSSCDSVSALPKFCCPLNASVHESSATSSPTSALPTVPTASSTGRNATIYEKGVSDGRGLIAGQKCAAYASFILPNSTRTIGDSQCTDIRDSGRIQSSRDGETNEFPYIAKIGSDTGLGIIVWMCGATLISENYVISVAHCYQHDVYGRAAWIRLGGWRNNRGDRMYLLERSITQVILHPSFRASNPDNDVALYKMDHPVTFDASILPACLHRLPHVDTNSPVIVTGWLQMDFESTGSGSMSELSTKNARIVDQATCNTSYPFNQRLPDGIFGDSIICTGDHTSDNCLTSLGGSAMVLPSNNYVCMKELVGIGGFDQLCVGNKPMAYLRIYHYIRWIESVVWPEDEVSQTP